MRVSLQPLAKEVIGYGVGAVFNRILGIVVACVYPIFLSRSEYGRIDVVFSIMALLTMLFYVGLDSALARFYYEQEAIEHRRRLVSTVFYSVMGFAVLSCGLLLIFSKPLVLRLYGDSHYIYYFRLAMLSLPFAMAYGMQLTVLRLERRVRAFNLIMASNLVIAAVCGVSSIVLFRAGAAGVLMGFIAGNIVTSIAGIFLNRRELSEPPAWHRLRELVGFGLPLVPSAAAMWLIGNVNRPFLVQNVSPDDIGLFAIASGGVGMLGLLLAAFRNAWQPFAFSVIGREGSGEAYGRALTLFTAAGASLAVAGSVFAPEGLLLINAYTHKNWSGAAPCVGPLAMGLLFGAMYYVVQTGAFIARRTGVIAVTMGIAATANILFNIILIPRWGILGAAYATAMGDLIALVVLYALAQRIARIPYQPVKLILSVFSAGVVVWGASLIRMHSLMAAVLWKISLIAGFIAVLLIVRAFRLRDLVLFAKPYASVLRRKGTGA